MRYTFTYKMCVSKNELRLLFVDGIKGKTGILFADEGNNFIIKCE